MSETEFHPTGLDVTVTDPDGGMVLRWALVAEVIDEDGTESLRAHGSNGISSWTRLGLLEYGSALIRASLTVEFCEGDQ